MENKSLRYRLTNWLSGGELAQLREYVLGKGAFTGTEQDYGRSSEMFSPTEYGRYIATSNAVYTCATIRAELLASLPLKFFKVRNGQKVEVDSGQLLDLFHKVNPFWTFSRLVKMTSYSLDLWGVNFWFLERGESGNLTPQEIWWSRPDRVKVVPHETDYLAGFLYTPPNEQRPIPFATDEVVWMPNPNPIDEFSGLAPLAAARLAADTGSAGMQSNKSIYDQGLMLGGLLTPPKDVTFTPDQAHELERDLDQRFAGLDKAHRIGVLRFKGEIQTPALTPRDIDFLNGLKWSLEEVCRAYKIPLDLVGGQRTYQNVEGALKAVWTNAIIPLSRFIAEEITEKVLPLFPNQADIAEFDLTKVEVLQEDRSELVLQMTRLWRMGVPINDLLSEFLPNLLPEGGKFAWGDIWYAPASLYPVSDDNPIPPSMLGLEEGEQSERALTSIPAQSAIRQIEYGSQEHERIWNIHERRLTASEKKVEKELQKLFDRQKDSVIDRLKQPSRSIEDVLENPFDLPQWISIFRKGIKAIIREITKGAGQDAYDDLGLALTFDVDTPEVTRFMEARNQRFAIKVNETTWEAIRAEVAKGLDEGEGIPEMEKRLSKTFREWAGKDPAVAEKLSRLEMIARTEAVGATTGGTLEAWEQSGVVELKTWLGSLDSRIRDTHISAHNTYQANPIPIQDDFFVGAGSGAGPGLIGLPEEDINCRCVMQPVVSERSNNGYSRLDLARLENVEKLLASIHQ